MRTDMVEQTPSFHFIRPHLYTSINCGIRLGRCEESDGLMTMFFTYPLCPRRAQLLPTESLYQR
jgi:hypothetical protein